MNLNFKNFDWPENFMRDIGAATEEEAVAILDKLENNRWKGIVLLRYKEGLSGREIAPKCQISSQRVFELLKKILKKCKGIARQLQEGPVPEDPIQEKVPSGVPIESLKIERGASNSLKRAGIDTIEKAIKHLEDKGTFKDLRFVGEKYDGEIRSELEKIIKNSIH